MGKQCYMIALMSILLSPSFIMPTKNTINAALVSLLITFSVSAAADVNVVTTIRPLEFIAKAVIGDLGRTDSLIGRNASPHHFNFTPGNRRALNNADIVVWIGPEFEVHLSENMARLVKDRPLITAFSLPSFNTLTLDESGTKDGHAWLSAQNAVAIATALVQQLSIVDPANGPSYTANLAEFKAQLDITFSAIQTRLTGYQDVSYLVYHNGFQYFEQDYGLTHLAPLVLDPEVSPSINRIVAVRELIAKENPRCLMSEADANTELVITFTRGAQIKIVDVDLLGYDIPVSQQAYGQLLESVAGSFESCLSATH